METIAQDDSPVEELPSVKKAGVRKKRRKQRDPKRHSRSASSEFDSGDKTPPLPHSMEDPICLQTSKSRPIESEIITKNMTEADGEKHIEEYFSNSESPSKFLLRSYSVQDEEENDQALDLSKRGCERTMLVPSDTSNSFNKLLTVPRDDSVQMLSSSSKHTRKRKTWPDSFPEWQHKIFKTNEVHCDNRKLIKRSEYAVAGLQVQHLLPSSVNMELLQRNEAKDSRSTGQKVIPLSAKCPDTGGGLSRKTLSNGIGLQHFEEKTTFLSRQEINNNAANRQSPKHSDSESDTSQQQSPFPANGQQKGLNRSRRIVANARERNRVHTISAAFEGLRRAVPCYSHNQKLSKLAILRIACSYILALAKLADLDYGPEQEKMSFSDCVDLCTMTLQAEGRSKRKKNQD